MIDINNPPESDELLAKTHPAALLLEQANLRRSLGTWHCTSCNAVAPATSDFCPRCNAARGAR